MNLKKKKKLAAKTLGVGVNRIVFDKERLDEIKEAITRQDIIDLFKEGVIKIREKKGRRKKLKKKRRKEGSIKKRIKKEKEEYVKIVRKLRKYLKNLKEKNKIERDKYYDLRKKIKQKKFNSLKHLIQEINKENKK